MLVRHYRVGWLVRLLRGGLIATVIIEDITEVKITILLATRRLQTLVDLRNHVVCSFFAQQHHDKFYNIVNEKVNISMSNLLVLLLFEFFPTKLSLCFSLSVFLVADTQLYKRLCPSVRPFVHPSVRKHESKSGKTSVLEAFCVCVCVGRGVGWSVGCGWGLAAPAHPSATIL